MIYIKLEDKYTRDEWNTWYPYKIQPVHGNSVIDEQGWDWDMANEIEKELIAAFPDDYKGQQEAGEEIFCAKDHCFWWLAKNGFIPISETFFYKP